MESGSERQSEQSIVHNIQAWNKVSVSQTLNVTEDQIKKGICESLGNKQAWHTFQKVGNI